TKAGRHPTAGPVKGGPRDSVQPTKAGQLPTVVPVIGGPRGSVPPTRAGQLPTVVPVKGGPRDSVQPTKAGQHPTAGPGKVGPRDSLQPRKPCQRRRGCPVKGDRRVSVESTESGSDESGVVPKFATEKRRELMARERSSISRKKGGAARKALGGWVSGIGIRGIVSTVSTKRHRNCDTILSAEIDCENGHKISTDMDKILGSFLVNNCSSRIFSADISLSEGVIAKLSSLLNEQLLHNGSKDEPNISFMKAIGNETHTRFYYSCIADKEYHTEIEAALRTICKDKGLHDTIDEYQRSSCNGDSSILDSSSDDYSHSSFENTEQPDEKFQSDSSDSTFLNASKECKSKRTSNKCTKRRTGHITRILSTTYDLGFKQRGGYNSACARCALRKISSTLLLEGITLEQISSRLCGRFPQNFKYILAAEVRKYQRVGLKSIEITSISVDQKQNLIVDFDIIVDPQYNALVRSALRRAVITLDLKRVFKYQQRY
ncbi:unnamed protein product, partial [Rotaria socialis]